MLGLLAAREREPARGLEAFAGCGVRWLVEHLLRPDRTEPDPEPMRRGALAHAVLERTLTCCASAPARRGSRRSRSPPRWRRSPTRCPSALARPARDGRARALLRGLEADLERYLRTEAECGAGFEPTQLEWSFGGADDAHGPLPLGDGERA